MIGKKNVFIIGDSYSTYEGYIPEGYEFFYSDGRKDEPVVKGADKTWWRILAKDMDFNIVLNDSYSGSTVCNTVRENFTVDTSFINRMDKYIREDFFAKNNVDTVLVFGGTNDSWIDSPVGELTYSDPTEDELKCVLPAFCYLLHRIKEIGLHAVVIVNTGLKPEIADNFALACGKYSADCVKLCDIDKADGHPTALGMRQIAEQIKNSVSFD